VVEAHEALQVFDNLLSLVGSSWWFHFLPRFLLAMFLRK
jgi:hypothetical protein